MRAARRIRVVGAGYVGLVTAVGMLESGYSVELVEAREDRRNLLRAGTMPIFEPGVAEILGPALADARISVCAAPTDDAVDLVLLCVGTPIDDEGASDLSQLEAALHASRLSLGRGTPVVVRSTTPVGSVRRLVEELGVPDPLLFLNPEFLRQGTALEDFMRPARVVIGAADDSDPTAMVVVEQALAASGAPVLSVTYEEAELIKNAANAFLALKLSFINELALLTEVVGGDIGRVWAGLALDPRIGSPNLRSSFGFGGSCLPKELRNLATAGQSRGLPMHVTSAAAAANASTQANFAARIETLLGGLEGRVVAVLGLAFKAGTDDVRESPALRIAGLLRDAGAQVRAYDPQATTNARRAAPWLEICPTAQAALVDADAAVIATEWSEFKTLDWNAIGPTMRAKTIIDGRRLLNGRVMRDLGYRYAAVGTGDGA
jgi:UDPglucose 6-dehydrogenase